MTKIKQLIFLFLALQIFSVKAQDFRSGAERINSYLHLVKEKRVAIVGNHTSMIKNTHLIDTLLSLKVNIINIFSPEHGIRGDADAGAEIKNEIDKLTGIPIISLYGINKKPITEQLKGIEVIIFDIQDVGVRFYTYISTLHYVMEAAAENNIELIVMDRPNPNGHYIDGPIRKKGFESFVGLHPIPIVYGMTIGELAKMINGENWISKKCNLKIIKMKNYNHSKRYSLPINPSPNLPNSRSINLYPSLCLFEGTSISVGRGTEYPFQHFGSPYLKSNYSFKPRSVKGSKYPKYENIKCFGENLTNIDYYLSEINLSWIIDSYNECTKKEIFFNDFFDKLAGSDQLRLKIISGMNSDNIKMSWQKDLKKFKKIRELYLLYN